MNIAAAEEDFPSGYSHDPALAKQLLQAPGCHSVGTRIEERHHYRAVGEVEIHVAHGEQAARPGLPLLLRLRQGDDFQRAPLRIRHRFQHAARFLNRRVPRALALIALTAAVFAVTAPAGAQDCATSGSGTVLQRAAAGLYLLVYTAAGA